MNDILHISDKHDNRISYMTFSNSQSIWRAQFKFGFIFFFKAMWEHFLFYELKLGIAHRLDTHRGKGNSQRF